MLSSTSKQLNKAQRIMQYCNMVTSSSMEFFRKKFTHNRRQISKPIIKKEYYGKESLKGIVYVNPNIQQLLKKNPETTLRIRNYIMNNLMSR